MYHAVVEENDVDLEKSQPNLENNSVSETEDKAEQVKGGEILEPYVGMEFESEDDARKLYTDYSKRVGFVMRTKQPVRSKTDGGTLTGCCLVCNKHDLLLPSLKGKTGTHKKIRPGCKATLLIVKQDKSGKWVVTRFVKEHNHPLDVPSHKNIDSRDKDKKIHELTGELQRQEEVFAELRESFINLVGDIEKQVVDQHLSPKVLAVVQNVKKAETEALLISRA